MLIDAVVVNASPLIALFRSAQADLLPGLFARIVVPEAVWREVVLEGHDDSAATGLAGQSWPIPEDVTVSPRVAAWNLSAGESSVLSYALAHPPLRAVIDDADARRCARTLGIPILGTGGVILLAKRRGLIDSVTTGGNRSRDAGLWISDGLVELMKKQAGEQGRCPATCVPLVAVKPYSAHSEPRGKVTASNGSTATSASPTKLA